MSAREEPFKATRERLSSAIRAALDEAQAIADSDTAYRQASWLVDVLSTGMTASGRMRAAAARRIREENGLSIAQLGERLGVSKARAQDILRVAQTRQPESPPVITPIVTSELGVLAGRGKDEKAPWTLIASQPEAGESPGEAASRKIKDETGLDVIAGRVVVRRIDPDTGRTMVYVAARPADPKQLDLHPGGSGDWAEARWLSLAEAEELLPEIYEPVNAYLSRALRPRHPAP